MVITDKETILAFLRGEGSDHLGRFYQDTITWTNTQLEKCNDQVQWLFPSHEHSNYAHTYPILSREIVEEGKKDKKVLDNLRKAKKRFEDFYGIGEEKDETRQHQWCKALNHNLLRITRIIRCLRLFGLYDEAEEFYKNVLIAEANCGLSNVTKAYWWRAAKEGVWETLR